ncbi:helix-turn-helix domain-containing protein [Winogradskyella sp. 3972H.M.0a.05]|uniref:helix-turn-helix domain-containing protein n=1 Tax=Winogradskyella sp. 3972H.M.0a.05 TaxID=2950277 RepID=UPI00339B5DB6
MDSRISKTLDYIENNLSLKLTLNDLAKVSCMSPSHFHRVFKKETGRTPFEFIEALKMNKAYQMLLSDSPMVHQLTETFGYNDYETFSRAFKKYHSLAPDDFRAIVQKIKSEMSVGPESLFIKTFEVDKISEIKTTLDQITTYLQTFLEEKGYSKEDIEKAKVMSVLPKLENSENDGNIIKNKFVIVDNQKIWKALLNSTLNGN